jgi:hypothetical protein
MTKMLTFTLLTGAILFTSASANAQVSVGINLGVPVEPVYPVPTYITPAPDWPSNHYDIHRHRHNDYWAHRQQEHAEHHG